MTWNGENRNVTIDSHTYDIGEKINKKNNGDIRICHNSNERY